MEAGRGPGSLQHTERPWLSAAHLPGVCTDITTPGKSGESILVQQISAQKCSRRTFLPELSWCEGHDKSCPSTFLSQGGKVSGNWHRDIRGSWLQ